MAPQLAKRTFAATAVLAVLCCLSCAPKDTPELEQSTLSIAGVSCKVTAPASWGSIKALAIPIEEHPSLMQVSGTITNTSTEPVEDPTMGLRQAGFEWYLPRLKPYERVHFEFVDRAISGVISNSYVGRIALTVYGKRGANYFQYADPHEYPCFRDSTISAASLPAECRGRYYGMGDVLRGKDGNCYIAQEVRFFRWLSPTRALSGDKDKPILFEFSSPPTIKLGLNSSVVVQDGKYNYKNEFGVPLTIPRLRILTSLQVVARKPGRSMPTRPISSTPAKTSKIK